MHRCTLAHTLALSSWPWMCNPPFSKCATRYGCSLLIPYLNLPFTLPERKPAFHCPLCPCIVHVAIMRCTSDARDSMVHIWCTNLVMLTFHCTRLMHGTPWCMVAPHGARLVHDFMVHVWCIRLHGAVCYILVNVWCMISLVFVWCMLTLHDARPFFGRLPFVSMTWNLSSYEHKPVFLFVFSVSLCPSVSRVRLSIFWAQTCLTIKQCGSHYITYLGFFFTWYALKWL